MLKIQQNALDTIWGKASLLHKMYLKTLNYLIYLSIYLFIYFRKKERRQIDQQTQTDRHWFVFPFIYDFTCCFLYVSRPGIEPATLAHWNDALIELHSQGLNNILGDMKDFNMCVANAVRMSFFFPLSKDNLNLLKQLYKFFIVRLYSAAY